MATKIDATGSSSCTSQTKWEKAARVELKNLLDFIGTEGVVSAQYEWHVERLCNEIRVLLATKTEAEAFPQHELDGTHV